ncbi:alpha/beta fold hydrolase [Rubellimicrobium sp. CFH 75288]|uniref:alpha/beta fold hydrolase n=1 Tax=Rubellimicrobium sp. CFH 75288 TaxID=2697034 RepID=UPI0014131AEF|nr:alpha/beta hydrolase [Rubellimicrobium sp. CFH 75288]NAZ35460.1 alpha/beta fold hydrolase [Rubellimicrobium sp. CFH 75288]
MPRINAADGTSLHLQDWGSGRPVVLIHGWPLNADSWDHQARHLAAAGYRVVACDRRGFGRSDRPWGGYDYDTLADDLAAVIDGLGLTDATLVGFSMGGGEVARYMRRHGGRGVARVAFVGSIVPCLVRRDDNPDGVPADALDSMQEAIDKDRPEFLRGFFKTFYGQGLVSGVSQGVLDWSLHMALLASGRATLACIDAWREDFRPDIVAIDRPALVIHGTGDAIVPIEPTARAAARAIPGATLREYDGAPHGLLATHAARVTQDLLDFLA